MWVFTQSRRVSRFKSSKAGQTHLAQVTWSLCSSCAAASPAKSDFVLLWDNLFNQCQADFISVSLIRWLSYWFLQYMYMYMTLFISLSFKKFSELLNGCTLFVAVTQWPCASTIIVSIYLWNNWKGGIGLAFYTCRLAPCLRALMWGFIEHVHTLVWILIHILPCKMAYFKLSSNLTDRTGCATYLFDTNMG